MRKRKVGEIILVGVAAVVFFATVSKGASFGPKAQAQSKQEKSKTIELTGVLQNASEGKHDLNVEIFADASLTEPLFSKEFRGVEISEGFYTLKINPEEAGLEVGKSYGLRIEVLGEDIPATEANLEIIPEQTYFAFEGEGGGAGIAAQQYNLTGNFPYPQAVVTVTNSGTGYGINSVSKKGVGLHAESQSAQGYGLYAKNTVAGGTALLSEGKAKVQGDLEVTGQTDLMSVNLPAGSVGSSEIVNGSIQNEDIAAGLNADTLDGKDSTEFLSSAEDAVLNGNLTVNGTGNNYFAGKLGIGTGNINLPSQLTVFQKEEGVTGIRVQGENAGAHVHVRPSRGKKGEISFTEDGAFDRWVMGIKSDDSNLYFSSGTTSLNTATLRLVINGDHGNVGIGTEFPGAKLDIQEKSDVGTDGLMVTSVNGWTSGLWNHGANKELHLYFGSDTGKIVFDTGSKEKMRIDANGHVGIGTSIPASKLDVTQTQEETLGLRVHGENAGAHVHIRPSKGKKGELSFTEDEVFDRWVMGIKPDDSNLYFSSGTSSLDTAIPRLTINGATGNVGIAATFPRGRLTIEPSVMDLNKIVLFDGGAGTPYRIGTEAGGGIVYNVDIADNNHFHDFRFGNSSIMRINGSGDVGIGVHPPTAKLDVNGYVKGRYGLCIGEDCRTSWPATGIGGGGSGNSLAKFNGPNMITNSIIQDDGSNVGIGLAPRPAKLSVYVPGNDTAISVVAGGPVGTYHLDIKPLIGNGVIDYQFAAIQEGVSAINVLTLRQNGNVDVGGNLRAANVTAHYQDLAEWAPSTQTLTPGIVVVIDEENDNHVVASTQAYDSKVAGVVSYQPGLLLGEGGEGRYMIAHTGRVKVKADASYGAIKKGDLLVTSPVEGMAMKSQPKIIDGEEFHRPGTILGKALESLSEGTGEILVLLALQ